MTLCLGVCIFLFTFVFHEVTSVHPPLICKNQTKMIFPSVQLHFQQTFRASAHALAELMDNALLRQTPVDWCARAGHAVVQCLPCKGQQSTIEMQGTTQSFVWRCFVRESALDLVPVSRLKTEEHDNTKNREIT